MNNIRQITKIYRNMVLYRNHQNSGKIINYNEFETLRFINKHPNSTHKDIVSYLGVDKSLITRIIKSLIEKEYIVQHEDANDKRQKRYQISERGQALKYDEVNAELHFYQKCLESLSEDEQDIFLKLLTKVYQTSKSYRKNNFKGL